MTTVKLTKELRGLIKKANTLSNRCRFGSYPMAPSVGLSEKEINLHRKALDAHGLVREKLKEIGERTLAAEHDRAVHDHSWVVNRVGAF